MIRAPPPRGKPIPSCHPQTTWMSGNKTRRRRSYSRALIAAKKPTRALLLYRCAVDESVSPMPVREGIIIDATRDNGMNKGRRWRANPVESYNTYKLLGYRPAKRGSKECNKGAREGEPGVIYVAIHRQLGCPRTIPGGEAYTRAPRTQ